MVLEGSGILQGMLTMPTLLLSPTEILSDSEEDQVSSNTNSYDYGEAPGSGPMGIGMSRNTGTWFRDALLSWEGRGIGLPGGATHSHTCPTWYTQAMNTGLCYWVRRPLPRS